MNSALMTLLTIFTTGLFGFCLLFWSKKYGNLEFNQIISLITLFFSCTMIFLMLVTIQSSQKSTDKYITTLKEEITNQINKNQEAAENQIEAIKKATEIEIAEIKEVQKNKKIFKLLAFKNELTLNIDLMKSIIKESEGLNDRSKYLLLPILFKTTTYYYDSVHDIPLTTELITEIRSLYEELHIANIFLEAAINAYVIQGKKKTGNNSDCWSYLVEFNKKVAIISNNNIRKATKILSEIDKIEAGLKNKS